MIQRTHPAEQAAAQLYVSLSRFTALYSTHLPPGHLPHSVGHRYIVEVEAVMHRDTRLEVVHDVAIDLQHKVCLYGALWRR